MMRSGNPALTDSTFTRQLATPASHAMTLQGSVNKTAIVLVIVVVGALLSWHKVFTQMETLNPMPWAIGSGLIGLVVAMVIIFKAHLAPVLTPIYALTQGVFLGLISGFFETMYPGIVPQAVGLTFATLFALLCAYRSGMIRATEKFKLGLMAAMGGIFLVYLASFALSFFGTQIPYIHESGLIGIGFSLFVVVIAALNLVLDFDFIEKGAARKAPQYMEWYAAFGLLVTLVWLYIEILHLLAKLRDSK